MAAVEESKPMEIEEAAAVVVVQEPVPVVAAPAPETTAPPPAPPAAVPEEAPKPAEAVKPAAETNGAEIPTEKPEIPAVVAPAAATAAAPAAAAAVPAAAAALLDTAPPKPSPVRQYLESTVVPILMQGMQQLVKERPEDPIQWIADFLQKNNPKKRKADAMK